MTSKTVDTSEAYAKELDRQDELSSYRSAFSIPPGPDGRDSVYFCGNSLGLQPKRAKELVTRDLDNWARFGVEGHFHADAPWYPYHEFVRAPLAKLVGAQEDEVVAMNTLTVNLHLLMVSFYRPTKDRFKILIDSPTFPSDVYAVQSQAAFHGFDPREAIISVRPRPGEHLLRSEDIIETIKRDGKSIALCLFAGVNFFSGQVYDFPTLARVAHDAGCIIGLDLAHAVGNIPLNLHDWDIDFAVWCSYKYLNSGPGAVAGAYVHTRHCHDGKLPRFSGWWGNDPNTRFTMAEKFTPVQSADAWQLSNPPIFSLAPLRASLELFSEIGMDRLREKSVRLTSYLEELIYSVAKAKFTIITPSESRYRGCQLSILVEGNAKHLVTRLGDAGVIVDFREPNIIRVAPTPLYNSFHDVWRFAQIFRETAVS